MNQKLGVEVKSTGTKSAKQMIRDHYRVIRRQHARQAATTPLAIAPYLEQILKLRPADGTWAVYKTHRDELDLAPAIQSLSARWPHLRWAYPRMNAQDSLEFFVPTASDWLVHSSQILEPNPETSQATTLEELAGVLVPGLAFDRGGHRIGSGKGYYDRALKGFRGLRVGVGYSVQISPDPFPNEQHDIQMDCLLTEKGVVKCERFKNESPTKG